MLRQTITLLALLFALPLAAQQAPPERTPADLPSVTLPAALDKVLRDYERAWKAADPKALVALFTEDAFVMQPGRRAVRGRAGLESVYTGQGGGDLRLRAFAYAESGDVAVIVGGYTYGDAPQDMGKFTLTLRKGPGGAWLIFSDMDNGNRAPRP